MTERLKVVQVITTFDIGGAQETVCATARLIDRTEFDVSIVCGVDDRDDGVLAGEMRAAGVRVTRLSGLRRSVGIADVAGFVALYRYFRRERPAIVHTHSSKAGVLGRLAARLARVPVVVHTVHAWSFDARSTPLVSWACTWLERALARLTDVIVVVARANQAAGEERGIRPRVEYRVIRSGIDLGAFTTTDPARRAGARAVLGLAADTPVIGTISRLAAPKDPITLVRAVARVADRQPDAIAVIVGEGPLAEQVEAECTRLGIEDRVRMIGERRDVADLLPAFDVFTLSTRWEGLPRVIVEAMATGLPVVASAVNGVPEAVEDGVTGRLVAAGDDAGLGAALIELLADPHRARDYGQQGAARAAEFDERLAVEHHAELYRAVVAAKQPVSVVHVITGLDPAGAEHMLARLVAATDPARVRSHVISLTDEGPVAIDIARSGVPVEALGMPRGRLTLAGLVRLYRRLRTLRPDVVQTWMYHADVVGGLAARVARVPEVIWNLRVADPAAIHASRSTRLVIAVAARLSKVVPSHIVVNARAAIDAHVAAGFADRPMTVIPNGFDTERFRADPDVRVAMRREFGFEPDELVVTYIARYSPQKDHATFLDAATRIAAAEPRARFLLAGTGVTDENLMLDAQLSEAGIRDRTQLLGSRSDVEAVLVASDVVASSSRMEGLPNAIAEAMACGVPVVATDVGDTRVLVGEAGKLVPAGDPAALAAGVLAVMHLHPEARRALGEAGAQRVRESFALQASVDAYSELFEAAARSHAAVVAR